MEQAVWLFFGLLALVVSAGAIAVRSVPQLVAQIATAFSVMVWAYWAISATNVVVITDGGGEIVRSYTGAMFLGLAAAAIMLLFLVESVFSLLGAGDTTDV